MKQKKEVSSKYIKWLSELNKDSITVAGGKGANLAEIYNLKLPVPPAFIITAQAYSYFIEKTGVGDAIKELLSELNIDDTSVLSDTSEKIREIIVKQEMPEDLKEDIIDNYEVLSVDKNVLKQASSEASSILRTGQEDTFVAVRSSATTEDLAEASFAGQQDTYLNIKGKSELIEAVKRCFASLFTARAVYYRERKGFDHSKAYLAVVVQKMVDSDKSGVMFSQDPVKNSGNVIIEAVYGLGEGIVSGKIKPDHYAVSRDLEVKEVNMANKKIAITRTGEGKNQIVKLTEERSKSRVLSDYHLKRLADFAVRLEEHYQKPQDIEFAIENDDIFIVQTRPITTKVVEGEGLNEVEMGDAILEGLPASPGIGSGVVRLVREMSDLKKIQKGDVLVTEMTNPDMVVSMQKASAIITDEGGLTSHAAIVSREMGIPAIVGTGEATKKLKDSQGVTVDGFKGKVYKGIHEEKKVEILPVVNTETEIKVIVDLPAFAERAAKSQAKAVGLMRLEGTIASNGKHPYYYVNNNSMQEYEDMIFNGIKGIAEHFEKVWIRTSDIRTDEYRELEGAPQEVEGNPMLGNHGVRDGLKHPDILRAEFRAVKRAAEQTNKKIGVMLPQIISVDEVIKSKKLAQEVGMIHENVEFGVMVETPASVQIIDKLCEEGIDFISFGTNDLTQYTLAIDRNNEEVQDIYNESHLAVLRQIARVIRICKKYNVESSICGQAGSKKDMVEFLVKHGIDSISVNADAAKQISELVKSLEDSGLRGKELIQEKQEPKPEIQQAEQKQEIQEEQKTEIKQAEVPEKLQQEQTQVKESKKIQHGEQVLIEIHDNDKTAYKTKCINCGNEAIIPYVPRKGKPVYCKPCYVQMKQQENQKEKQEQNNQKMQENKQKEVKNMEEKQAENMSNQSSQEKTQEQTYQNQSQSTENKAQKPQKKPLESETMSKQEEKPIIEQVEEKIEQAEQIIEEVTEEQEDSDEDSINEGVLDIF